MDMLAPLFLMCAAVTGVAAAALSLFTRSQRSHRGFGWWIGALWLNTAAAAAIGLLGWADVASTALPWLFAPWPLLSLLGLRRYHARDALPGSELQDLSLLALLLVAAVATPLWLPQAQLDGLLPLAASSATAIYAALVLWSVPQQHDVDGLGSLGALWLAVALLPALGAAWEQPLHALTLHAAIVALGSSAMAFVALTMSSQRTERVLRESQRRLRVLANIDMLTQVPNRRRFEELARRVLQLDEAGSATLLLVDIATQLLVQPAEAHALLLQPQPAAAGDRSAARRRSAPPCASDACRSCRTGSGSSPQCARWASRSRDPSASTPRGGSGCATGRGWRSRGCRCRPSSAAGSAAATRARAPPSRSRRRRHDGAFERREGEEVGFVLGDEDTLDTAAPAPRSCGVECDVGQSLAARQTGQRRVEQAKAERTGLSRKP
jgi:hypothetical protein